MDLQTAYRTATYNHDFGFHQYITPSCECDPKRQILQRTYEDYKHKPKQGKFKVTTRPRVCYFDEQAKPISAFPSPMKYKVEGNILRRTKSASLKKAKVDEKLKKQTYLDNIEAFQTKYKPPGVGKFDLTKHSDFEGSSSSKLKMNKDVIKHNNFDDAIKIAAELPGPGQFNPRKSVEKLRTNRTDIKFWKNKHEKEAKKSAKSLSTKLGPTTYNPISLDTFQYRAASTAKQISRWSHGNIQIRKGIRSEYKEPSPSQYNTVHQWAKLGQKEKPIGNYNILNRATSARTFGVYH